MCPWVAYGSKLLRRKERKQGKKTRTYNLRNEKQHNVTVRALIDPGGMNE